MPKRSKVAFRNKSHSGWWIFREVEQWVSKRHKILRPSSKCSVWENTRLIRAKNREEAWGRAEDKGKQWIATVQDSIDLGTADERGLLEPLRVWGNARINHLQALMDLNVALADLARVSGWDGAAPTAQ